MQKEGRIMAERGTHLGPLEVSASELAGLGLSPCCVWVFSGPRGWTPRSLPWTAASGGSAVQKRRNASWGSSSKSPSAQIKVYLYEQCKQTLHKLHLYIYIYLQQSREELQETLAHAKHNLSSNGMYSSQVKHWHCREHPFPLGVVTCQTGNQRG